MLLLIGRKMCGQPTLCIAVINGMKKGCNENESVNDEVHLATWIYQEDDENCNNMNKWPLDIECYINIYLQMYENV